MKLEAEVTGELKVAEELMEMAKRARDPRPAMRKARDIMITANRKQFETSGAYLGDPWPEDSEETLKRKRRKGQDTRPNRATGAMETALSGGRGRSTSATKTGARAGTKIFYARFAQVGTKNQPQRQVVGLHSRDRRKVLMVLDKFVRTGQIFP